MNVASPMVVAGIILAFTLLVFTLGKSPLFRVDRAGAAIIGAAVTIALGVLSFDQATRAVDYRTLALLFSMMIITANLRLSGFFQVVGNFLLRRVRTRRQLLLATVLASGVLSAFFINDIICLLFTPIVIMICRRAQIPVVPYLIAVATASNIGSAGTLIGNPQNILIGTISHLPFARYMLVAFPLALAGLFINYLAVAWFFRRDLAGPIPVTAPIQGGAHPVLIGKSLSVTGLILAGFLAGADAAIVAALGAAYMLVTRRVKPNKVYAGIDFNLLVIFIGLFVIIGGVEKSGLMNGLLQWTGFTRLGSFPLFSLLTVLLSNVFSNVPAVMLLKFFIPPGSAELWWIGMGVFSTLAGNLTLTGSIANLIVVELARHEGYRIGFIDYLKVGFPLTVVMTGLALLYFSWLFRF